MMEREELERRELVEAKGYLDYWKPQLRLDHMDFELVLMMPEENNNQYAQCKQNPTYHRQKIALRHPSQKSERNREDFRGDLEVCIVHELLHTKEVPWRDHPNVIKVLDDDEWLRKRHEDSLDAVAEALVRARRGICR